MPDGIACRLLDDGLPCLIIEEIDENAIFKKNAISYTHSTLRYRKCAVPELGELPS